MDSVSKRCYGYDLQPAGGYLSPKRLKAERMGGDDIPRKDENIDSVFTERAVRHLFELATGKCVRDTFSGTMDGAALVYEEAEAARLRAGVSGLDDASIANVCQLCVYDGNPHRTRGKIVEPNETTRSNIREMAERSLAFAEARGGTAAVGFAFGSGPDGMAADLGTFIAGDAMWILDTAATAPGKKDTLRLLVHYLLGRSSSPEFAGVRRIGIYNPRLDTAYSIDVAEIPRKALKSVDHDYVGYIITDRKPVRHYSPGVSLLQDLLALVSWLVLIGCIGFFALLFLAA